MRLAPICVNFFTDNPDFFNGSTFMQAPIYLVQGHLIDNFDSGVWMSLDSTYSVGDRTTVNGVRGDSVRDAALFTHLLTRQFQ